MNYQNQGLSYLPKWNGKAGTQTLGLINYIQWKNHIYELFYYLFFFLQSTIEDTFL